MNAEKLAIGELLNVIDSYFYMNNNQQNQIVSETEQVRIFTVLRGLLEILQENQHAYALTDEQVGRFSALVADIKTMSAIYPRAIWFRLIRAKFIVVVSELAQNDAVIQLLTHKIRCLIIPEHSVPKPECDFSEPNKNCANCFYKVMFEPR